MATHIHRVLQALLGLPTPRYRHHPLLTDATGRRLAKREGAPTIRVDAATGNDPGGDYRFGRGRPDPVSPRKRGEGVKRGRG